MSLLHPVYKHRYGYRWLDAVRAELWWRVEHAPYSEEGEPLNFLAHLGYRRRARAERRGQARRLFDPLFPQATPAAPPAEAKLETKPEIEPEFEPAPVRPGRASRPSGLAERL